MSTAQVQLTVTGEHGLVVAKALRLAIQSWVLQAGTDLRGAEVTVGAPILTATEQRQPKGDKLGYIGRTVGCPTGQTSASEAG